MAKYKQIRRNGRWITVDESGKEVGVGQGYLRDVARSIRDIGVYSDKTDSKGNPLTIREAKAQSSKPKPKPKPALKKVGEVAKLNGKDVVWDGKKWIEWSIENKPPKKPLPAEVTAAPTPERGSQQETTTTRPPAQPARTEPKPQAKPQAKQSSNMDDNYAAWVKANRKLAEKVKPGQAGYDSIQKALGKSSGNNDSMKIDQPASKSGSATTASSNTRFTADEEKRGSAAFNQDSVKRLPSKETAEQRRRRMARQGMA